MVSAAELQDLQPLVPLSPDQSLPNSYQRALTAKASCVGVQDKAGSATAHSHLQT